MIAETSRDVVRELSPWPDEADSRNCVNTTTHMNNNTHNNIIISQMDRGIAVSPADRDRAISSLVTRCTGLHADESRDRDDEEDLDEAHALWAARESQ